MCNRPLLDRSPFTRWFLRLSLYTFHSFINLIEFNLKSRNSYVRYALRVMRYASCGFLRIHMYVYSERVMRIHHAFLTSSTEFFFCSVADLCLKRCLCLS